MPPERDDPGPDEKEQVRQAIRSAVERVESPADAERVLDNVERIAQGVTEAAAGARAANRPLPPEEAIEQAAAAAPPGRRAAATLATTAAEVASGQPGAAETLEAAQEVFQPESHGRHSAPDLIKPRGYLQEAVLRRMSPAQAWDAWLFIVVNHLPHNHLTNGVMYALTVVMTGGFGWGVAAALAWLRGSRRAGPALSDLVPAVSVATWIAEYPIKAYFRRRRPFIDVVRALVIGKKPGSWSFPSGHTASSFASALVLSLHWPRYTSLYYALASLVGFSRVYLGAHYPGDVLSGAFAGTVLAALTRWAVGRLRGWRSGRRGRR